MSEAAQDTADRMAQALAEVVPADRVTAAADIGEDHLHDEAIGIFGVRPAAMVTPQSTAEVSAVLAWANENGTLVTVRGGRAPGRRAAPFPAPTACC
ncbi:MAG: hypothetical protein R2704_13965 [Microthrixaceae bacterium]